MSIIFGLGLVSSLHCVQMCGPVVLSYSLSLGPRTASQQLFAHLSYNVGRIVTYTLLGAVAGLAGQSIGLVGKLAGVENLAAILAGGMMVIAGLVMLDVLPPMRWGKFDPLLFLSRFFKPVGRRISSPDPASKFVLGLILGFLPCGLIYAALLRAIATGGAVAGASTMAAFGLGTLMALLAIGMFSSVFNFRFGRWGSRLAAFGVALLGAVLVWRGLVPMILEHGPHTAQCH